MAFYLDRKSKTWVVQLQRTAPDGTKLRRCERVRGGQSDAKSVESRMKDELVAEIDKLAQSHREKEKRKEAAVMLGLDPAKVDSPNGSVRPPKLRAYLTERWARHAAVVQKEATRRTTRTHVAYLTLYLGDLHLDEIDPAAIARLREGLLQDGPQSFKLNQDGKPRRTRTTTFKPLAVNRIMATLAAALRLAERERVIDRAPEVDLLPPDDSEPIVPPSDEQLAAILSTARDFIEIAPFMPEAIELAAQTGLRAGEQFTLPWRSVDLAMGDTGAIRVEAQHKVKLVDGRPWTPKYRKSRIVPLTPRARQIILGLRARLPHEPDDPVIPSRGGSPYNRLEAAPDKAGKGFFPDVVTASGIGVHVRWHDLRHYFAVRALLRGVPIAVVSSWLGHSDVNLTVKRYGRWASEAREQWAWARRMGEPVPAAAPRADSDRPAEPEEAA